jgi:hypothetical protein
MLPAVITHLPADRKRLGLSTVQMAGHLGLTYRQYLALEAGELEVHDNGGLYLRICQVCGWPDGRDTAAGTTTDSPTLADGEVDRVSCDA